MKINFILGENAKLPTKEHDTDAGYDIYAAEKVVVLHNERKLIKTNLSYEPVFNAEKTYLNMLNLGIYADVRDRSGNALKKGLTVLGGIIDQEYRGIIGVILYNTGDDVCIEIGDKIAQLIFTPCFLPKIDIVHSLEETSRGSKGFGSSGTAGTSII